MLKAAATTRHGLSWMIMVACWMGFIKHQQSQHVQSVSFLNSPSDYWGHWQDIFRKRDSCESSNECCLTCLKRFPCGLSRVINVNECSREKTLFSWRVCLKIHWYRHLNHAAKQRRMGDNFFCQEKEDNRKVSKGKKSKQPLPLTNDMDLLRRIQLHRWPIWDPFVHILTKLSTMSFLTAFQHHSYSDQFTLNFMRI